MLEEEICKLFQNQSDVNAKTYAIIKHLKELVFKLYEMDKDQNDQLKKELDQLKGQGK